MNRRTGGTMRAPPVHATPPGNCSFFHLLSGQLFELSFSWLTQLALFFFFFYWSFEMRTYLLNWEEMRNRGRKNSWLKQMEFRVLTIFFLLNDTVNRLSLKHENHKLLVAEAKSHPWFFFFSLFPMARATIWFTVQTGIMLRLKEVLTLQGTETTEISFVPGKPGIYSYPTHK